MALIQCKECGKEISSLAAACPHCGAPLNATPAVQATPVSTPPAAPAVAAGTAAAVKKPGKAAKTILGIFFMFCFMLVAIGMCSSGGAKKDSAGDKQDSAKDECKKDDLQCLGDKAVIAAGIYCKKPVEKLAAHSVRWTDGTLETKFSEFRWADKEAGTLTMVGDKVEFQNGFGAFTPMIYECDLAADGKTVLAVRAQEGRLK